MYYRTQHTSYIRRALYINIYIFFFEELEKESFFDFFVIKKENFKVIFHPYLSKKRRRILCFTHRNISFKTYIFHTVLSPQYTTYIFSFFFSLSIMYLEAILAF